MGSSRKKTLKGSVTLDVFGVTLCITRGTVWIETGKNLVCHPCIVTSMQVTMLAFTVGRKCVLLLREKGNAVTIFVDLWYGPNL